MSFKPSPKQIAWVTIKPADQADCQYAANTACTSLGF
jgi:hypothetical protein